MGVPQTSKVFEVAVDKVTVYEDVWEQVDRHQPICGLREEYELEDVVAHLAVSHKDSRLGSSTTNEMSEALLHIFINGPPVSEAQKLVKEDVESWVKAYKRRKLPPPANPGVTSSGKLQGEVQAILVESAVQEEVEEASVQAEVEAAVEAFKLADDQPNYDLDDSAFQSENKY